MTHYVGQNATVNGVDVWTPLYDGHLLTAAFTLYNEAFIGWAVVVLFVIYQFMLLIKTKNITLSWVTGVFFVSLYATSQFVNAIGLQVLFIILVFELAGILYFIFWKP